MPILGGCRFCKWLVETCRLDFHGLELTRATFGKPVCSDANNCTFGMQNGSRFAGDSSHGWLGGRAYGTTLNLPFICLGLFLLGDSPPPNNKQTGFLLGSSSTTTEKGMPQAPTHLYYSPGSLARSRRAKAAQREVCGACEGAAGSLLRFRRLPITVAKSPAYMGFAARLAGAGLTGPCVGGDGSWTNG